MPFSFSRMATSCGCSCACFNRYCGSVIPAIVSSSCCARLVTPPVVPCLRALARTNARIGGGYCVRYPLSVWQGPLAVRSTLHTQVGFDDLGVLFHFCGCALSDFFP